MTEKPVILTVGTNRTNLELLSQQLGREGYKTLSAASMEELDDAIQGKQGIALSLVDLSGFDQRIWQRCEQMRKTKIPFIVISPQRSPTIQRDSMKHGAGALLVKPIGIKELMEFVHTLLGD
ncbi:MAG: response regulator [Chloroflexota bacterium]